LTPSTKDSKSSSSDDQQYYRLVPLSASNAEKQQRLSFKELLNCFYRKRTVCYWFIGTFLIIGLLLAFTTPKNYSSGVTVVPEYELQDRVNEVIESYGLLFGLTGSIREEQRPAYLLKLYPHMISSVSFRQKLMHKPLEYDKADTSITLYQYFTALNKPTISQKIYRYTLGLPNTIMKAVQTPSPETKMASTSDTLGAESSSLFPIKEFTAKEKRVMATLAERITATYDRQSGVLQITAAMPKAKLAPQVVQLVLKTLHEQATDYKTSKGKKYVDYLQKKQKQQKKELEKARQRLITFKKTNSQPLNERMKLQSDYEANLDQYNALTTQLGRIKLTIREQMPTFQILDDITTPGTKVQPKRKLIVFLSLILGTFLALCWITVSFFIDKTRESQD